MPTKLKIKIAKHPSPAAALAAKEIRPSRRMLRAIFGTSRPQHRMAVLLPGSEASTVEVRVADTDDDLMALADAAGVTMLAAAGLAQPDLEQAAAEYEAAHRQAPEPAPEPEPVSLAQVRGVLAGLSSQGMTEQVRELIVATGADKLSAVDPTKYGWLLAKAKELSDA